MCTKNQLPKKILDLRASDSPIPIKAYKAVCKKPKKAPGSGLNTYSWKTGWNVAKGKCYSLDKKTKMMPQGFSVGSGAFHCSLTYKAAKKWLGRGNGDINHIMEVYILPKDVVAIERGGEIAARKVYVASTKAVADPAEALAPAAPNTLAVQP